MSGAHSAAERRIAANVEPVPADQPVRRCECGAAFLDYDLGRDAHEVALGHQPILRNGTSSERPASN